MKTSELFMDVFCDGGSTHGYCEFCFRTYFNDDSEGLEELRKKAVEQPEKYIEKDCGISRGFIDGRQFVYGCECDGLAKYEAFIWSHRGLIAEYLRKRAAAELEAAQRTA